VTVTLRLVHDWIFAYGGLLVIAAVVGRLTNAFSKKFENHCHMVALYAAWYNFVRIHKTLRCTPAMEAGGSDRLLSLEDMVGIVDEWEASQKKTTEEE